MIKKTILSFNYILFTIIISLLSLLKTLSTLSLSPVVLLSCWDCWTWECWDTVCGKSSYIASSNHGKQMTARYQWELLKKKYNLKNTKSKQCRGMCSRPTAEKVGITNFIPIPKKPTVISDTIWNLHSKSK